MRLCGARPASLELALCALKNEPVRARVAHVAVPKNEGRVGLDHLERVFALSWLCHLQFGQRFGQEARKR